MIEFCNLEIENFMAIESANLNLQNQGLVLIEGINNDDATSKSNGAGKSSIVDAIAWCLYGSTARGATADSVINEAAGKNCKVTTKLIIDGDLYMIERGRKHSVLKNRVKVMRFDDDDAMYVDITLGTDKLTQERIETLLGCNLETFNAAVYMGQEAMPDLPGMTDKALKSILESALSIDKLDDALNIAKMRADTIEASIRLKTASHMSTLQDREQAEKKITWYKDRRKEATLELHEIKETCEEELRGLNTIAATYERNVMEFQHYYNLMPPARDMESDPKLQALDDAWAIESEKNSQAFQKISDKLTELSLAQTACKAVIDCSDSECAACGRKFDDASDIERRLREATAEYENLETKKKLVQGKKTEIMRKILDARKDYDENRKAVYREITLENQDRAELTYKLKESGMNLQGTREKIAAVKKHMETSMQSKQKQIAGIVSEIKGLNECMETYLDRLESLDKEIEALREQEEVINKVVHVLGRKGFRGEVLDQVTPYLNFRTQYYLNWLTEGNINATWVTMAENSSGDYTESFHIEVEHVSGVKKFASLSGGEKRKVRLATALALQDLVGTRAVKPIKLFVADEIDDAIDGTGLELLMGLLEEKAKSVGTMFIISHNELSDYAKQRITVVKSGGKSTIEQP